MRADFDWHDLTYFLAVARRGTLSAAARDLHVDVGTVSRRIAALEEHLELRCFERRPGGYPLSEQGRSLFKHVEKVERQVASLGSVVDAAEAAVSRIVSITAPESVISFFVLPALKTLHALHPDIRVHLVPDNRILSLAQREVDLAIRLGRPEEAELLSRKIGTMGFGLYGSNEYLMQHGLPKSLQDLAQHNLIDWTEEYARVAPVAWFRKVGAKSPVVLKVNGAGERLRSAQLDIGLTVLPYLLARASGLCRVLPEAVIPSLPVWLVVHPEAGRIKRVRTVLNFIAEQAFANRALLSRAEP